VQPEVSTAELHGSKEQKEEYRQDKGELDNRLPSSPGVLHDRH